jgi:hypothetical protein
MGSIEHASNALDVLLPRTIFNFVIAPDIEQIR